MEPVLLEQVPSEMEGEPKKPEPLPFTMRFAERMDRPTKQTEPLKMLTRTTCGKDNYWDDSDV